MSVDLVVEKYKSAQAALDRAKAAVDLFQQEVTAMQAQNAATMEQLQFPVIPKVSRDLLIAFMKQPYLLLPKRADAYYVIVPRFIDMQLGWLEFTTPSYNVFVVNRYVRWMAPLPPEIESRLGPAPATDAKVVHGLLKVSPGTEDSAWTRYRKFLLKRDQYGIHVQKGYEMELIRHLVKDGYLPFERTPVQREDIRPLSGFEPRPYQRDALEKWLEWGHVGIYWAGGMGKTYLGAAICAMVKGAKLVVVPSVTEKEQWKLYLRHFKMENEVAVETYQSFHRVANKEYTLIVFDEAHRLPAPKWSQFATLRTKYRLGFSATPYREDGQENLIIALTGFPVGLSWGDFLQTRTIRKPRIVCRVVSTDAEKMTVLESLLRLPLKTLIFVELIDSGEKIAEHFGLPFVYGQSTNRLDTIRDNLVTVVSRVGDEGISVKDLERTIEVEFLGKSRRQEAQRAYRLLHSVKEEISHTVIMTTAELDKFGSRFLALEEKGFQVEYVC